jgi:peptidoglycan hydrolase CwlO-like protein
MKKMKIRKRLGLFVFVNCLLSAVLLLSFSNVVAATLQQQRDALDQQAAAAAQAKAQKEKDAAAIQAQISIVAKNIALVQSALAETERQVSDTKKKIEDLKTKIAAEEDKLQKEKEKANSIIASWYMKSEAGLLTAILSSNSLSDMVTEQEQYTSIQDQIEEIVNQIEIYKSQLSAQKVEQDQQLIDLQNLQQNQRNQKNELDEQKNMQNRLLTDTKNAITDLANQQAAAEAKARELTKLINAIYSSGSGTPQGNSLIQDSNWSWYYSQIDSRWSSKTLSPSYMTIGQVGCLVTSFAMVATYHGHQYTPADIADMSTFDYDGSWRWFNSSPGISVGGSQAKNWDVINYELSHNRPVIVSVKVAGPVYNSDGSNHFIVISGVSDGKYLIHDPYWRNSSYNLSDVISMKLVR